MVQTAFVAYPGAYPLLRDAIHRANELCEGSNVRLVPWEKLKTTGFKIDDLVREKINEATVLIADITYPNMNVFYEIGYATAHRKPVMPIVHAAVQQATARIQKMGLFDTIGWHSYANGEDLFRGISDFSAFSWVNNLTIRKDHSQPLYIIDTLIKTDFRNHIFHAVENSKVIYRRFDPTETPRLTAAQAISDISSSSGVVVPFLGIDVVDSFYHNMRAAFCLGLSHGFGIEVLAIQYDHEPAPLDYRDFITNSTYRYETERHVTEFSLNVLIWNQQSQGVSESRQLSLLSKIDLGSPMAENETQTLSAYFVKTSEFGRAVRSENAIVVGRKGSGKSAIFFQTSIAAQRSRKSFVLDLRPASHNLSEMREALLSVISAGVFDHTIASFWLYILYFEVLLQVREGVLPLSRNDFALQEKIRNMEEKFSLDDSIVSGDFTSRLDTAVQNVIRMLNDINNPEDVRSQITNMMFQNLIPDLREAILSFSDNYETIHIFVDDLDKGWPPRQIENHDVLVVRHLAEALSRMQRDLRRRDVDIKYILFLRSDVYDKLVSLTADRQKYNVINVDWSDPEQLRNLLKERVVSNIEENEKEKAWEVFNPLIGKDGDGVGLLIENSLRRPRFLIELCERALSFAINRGHVNVERNDIEEAIREFSLYLVSDFGYEMRDVAGTPEDIFYSFIGAGSVLSYNEVIDKIKNSGFELDFEETIELLLWYGFLGIIRNTGEAVFIYDRAYDFRRLEAERAAVGESVKFALNPAFLRGLN